MSDLLLELGFSEGLRPRPNGPCTGELLGSVRLPWTAYELKA